MESSANISDTELLIRYILIFSRRRKKNLKRFPLK